MCGDHPCSIDFEILKKTREYAEGRLSDMALKATSEYIKERLDA